MILKIKRLAYLVGFLISICSAQDSIGLSVKEGVIYHRKKPIQTIGVNYFDLFHRVLKDPNDKSYERGFSELKNYNIQFVRFPLTTWWAYEFKLYFDDRKEFFRRLDELVKSAEMHQIGLMPSFLFKFSAIPDMMGEPNQALGDPNSKTTAFVKKFTSEVVLRYRHSPSIWAWEFGNEFDLVVDLPKENQSPSSLGQTFNPKIEASWWCPPSRTQKDVLRTADMLHVMKVFADTVRLFDSHRMLSTGNAVPRAGSWHLYHHGKWGKNTLENFIEMLGMQNPEPYTVCQHLYPAEPEAEAREIEGHPGDPYYRMTISAQWAKQNKRAYILGEWSWGRHFADWIGKPEEPDKAKKMRECVDLYIETIQKNNIQLSAFWVYDFDLNTPDSQIYTVRGDNRRAWVLDKIKEFNTKKSSNK